ncbi:MAG: hypothetical protein H6566_01730 [Lewinellaceae bacterium]|nr:hypothetical protein [Lewinellaceae bacterium]
MKVFQLMFLMIILGSFSACTNSSSSDDVQPNNPNTALVNNGQWRVSYYFDKDKDETSDFNGYTFTFLDGGVLEASQNGNVTAGTWRVADDDSRRKLIIVIGQAKPLSDLSDDWIIVDWNDSKIKLQDDNTEHLEELHFSAI